VKEKIGSEKIGNYLMNASKVNKNDLFLGILGKSELIKTAKVIKKCLCQYFMEDLIFFIFEYRFPSNKEITFT